MSAKMSDYIPPELISNILARLPIDDVLRCTSVCKSWYSLITCPFFASSHLNLSSSNQEPRLLFRYYWRNENLSYCLRRDNQTFDEIAELDSPCSDDSGWQVIDCFNGLFCLHHNNSGRIMLWNPSIRKSFLLPNPWVSSKHTVGFAYVPAVNDYKIVRFSYACKTQPQPQAEIFQLSTGSWRNLELENYPYASVCWAQAHLNSILHWRARNSEKDKPALSNPIISSFDMKTEKFGALMLSSSLCREGRASVLVPSTFRESLCLIGNIYYQFCEMWIMKEYGVADSWEKLLVIDTSHHALTYFCNVKHNGEFLFGKVYRTDTRKTDLVSYDCNTNKVKNVQFMADGPVILSIYTYVESLVLMKGLNEVKIDEESRFDVRIERT